MYNSFQPPYGIGQPYQPQQHHQPPQLRLPSSNYNYRPVGIFWDIENCPLRSDKSASFVIDRIRYYFVRRSTYREYEFLVACDVTRLRKDIPDDINRSGGVTLAHVSGDKKNAADEKIREHMRRFVDTQTQAHVSLPPVIILISSDIDYVNDLRGYQTRLGCEIILLYGASCSQQFKQGWQETHSFEEFCDQCCSEDDSLSQPTGPIKSVLENIIEPSASIQNPIPTHSQIINEQIAREKLLQNIHLNHQFMPPRLPNPQHQLIAEKLALEKMFQMAKIYQQQQEMVKFNLNSPPPPYIGLQNPNVNRIPPPMFPKFSNEIGGVKMGKISPIYNVPEKKTDGKINVPLENSSINEDKDLKIPPEKEVKILIKVEKKLDSKESCSSSVKEEKDNYKSNEEPKIEMENDNGKVGKLPESNLENSQKAKVDEVFSKIDSMIEKINNAKNDADLEIKPKGDEMTDKTITLKLKTLETDSKINLFTNSVPSSLLPKLVQKEDSVDNSNLDAQQNPTVEKSSSSKLSQPSSQSHNLSNVKVEKSNEVLTEIKKQSATNLQNASNSSKLNEILENKDPKSSTNLQSALPSEAINKNDNKNTKTITPSTSSNLPKSAPSSQLVENKKARVFTSTHLKNPPLSADKKTGKEVEKSSETIIMAMGLPGKEEHRILRQRLQKLVHPFEGNVKYVNNGSGFISFKTKSNAQRCYAELDTVGEFGKNLVLSYVGRIPFPDSPFYAKTYSKNENYGSMSSLCSNNSKENSNAGVSVFISGLPPGKKHFDTLKGRLGEICKVLGGELTYLNYRNGTAFVEFWDEKKAKNGIKVLSSGEGFGDFGSGRKLFVTYAGDGRPQDPEDEVREYTLVASGSSNNSSSPHSSKDSKCKFGQNSKNIAAFAPTFIYDKNSMPEFVENITKGPAISSTKSCSSKFDENSKNVTKIDGNFVPSSLVENQIPKTKTSTNINLSTTSNNQSSDSSVNIPTELLIKNTGDSKMAANSSVAQSVDKNEDKKYLLMVAKSPAPGGADDENETLFKKQLRKLIKPLNGIVEVVKLNVAYVSFGSQVDSSEASTLFSSSILDGRKLTPFPAERIPHQLLKDKLVSAPRSAPTLSSKTPPVPTPTKTSKLPVFSPSLGEETSRSPQRVLSSFSSTNITSTENEFNFGAQGPCKDMTEDEFKKMLNKHLLYPTSGPVEPFPIKNLTPTKKTEDLLLGAESSLDFAQPTPSLAHILESSPFMAFNSLDDSSSKNLVEQERLRDCYNSEENRIRADELRHISAKSMGDIEQMALDIVLQQQLKYSNYLAQKDIEIKKEMELQHQKRESEAQFSININMSEVDRKFYPQPFEEVATEAGMNYFNPNNGQSRSFQQEMKNPQEINRNFRGVSNSASATISSPFSPKAKNSSSPAPKDKNKSCTIQ